MNKQIVEKEGAFIDLLNQETQELQVHLDYINGYKQGFKEGVEALRTQLKEVIFEVCIDGEIYDKVVFESDIDGICEELEDQK